MNSIVSKVNNTVLVMKQLELKHKYSEIDENIRT